ncbi:MAG: precorrin-3B C(17)-methyltransferase [Cyanobacteria bacterium M_surface_7_m2_040]|nr:precorrin-3B C(17)-methyltransferase [Cyanobacteria bacterium K_Offshore_0m_m2_072]MBM5827982.1 precorrin-3B C(17)-methyltransferase [Cyanobacteria bacterium M_surface_7_m2_040]
MDAAAPIWGLGFTTAARGLLARLKQAQLIDAIAVSGDADQQPATLLQQHWAQAGGFVVVGAAGLVTRLIAPLLGGKHTDPPVVVLDPAGRFAIPLLSGHRGGAEALSQRIAALLGGTAVLTGSSSGGDRLALDSFGRAWGWQRGSGDWDALMKQAARDQPVAVQQPAGLTLWRQCPAAEALLQSPCHNGADQSDLTIDARSGPGCRWHPPLLWLGLGCERNTSLTVLQRLVAQTLAAHGLASEAVAGIASIDRKGDEPALLALSEARGWPLRLFNATELNAVAVPTPSAAVAREMGTASVAEASALLAAGPEAALLIPKTVLHATTTAASPQAPGPSFEQGAATLAVAAALQQWAPQRGELHLVGTGPGQLQLLTGEAHEALSRCSTWVGYGLYLDLLEPLRRPDQVRLDGQLTRERERCRQALELACQGVKVALVSSGDSGIYGMAGLALELWLAQEDADRPAFAVHPGISALQLAAARCGAPLMHDFCTISLSDRLTPWEVIERRLIAAAAGDFVVALYNPRSQGRDWQLGRAQELLLQGRPGTTPVALARQLGRPEEHVSLHTLGELPIEQVDMLTLVLVGNSSTRAEAGRLVTPRGYPGAELA